MRSKWTVLVVLSVLLSGAGCYRYRVVVDENPSTEYQGETVHAFVWGLYMCPKKVEAENCHPDQSQKPINMDEVRASTNLAYAFITVITLGLWAPMDMEWRCAKAESSTGVFGRE